MASMWGLGGLTWKQLGKRVWNEINEDDIWGRAAQLSYYFLLALFPLLLFLMTMLGYLASGTELRDQLLAYLKQVMPSSASTLVYTTMEGIIQEKGGGKLSFGLLAALWAASNGMSAISETLNVAYNVKETRPWWKARLTTIGLTITLAVLIILALTIVFYGGRIAESVADFYGLGVVFVWSWKILQWPIAVAFVLLTFSLIYYFGPSVQDQDWKWITPGSVLGVALWLLVSFGFRLYLHFFDSYSATYGSLGALIVLMLWFYLTGAAILIGGEINSEIENAAAEAGATDAKEHGEQRPDDGKKASNPAKKRNAAKA